ncbi:hypothetical protein FTO68_01850 [Methanocalculus taiwanensis]|uniref:Uncharacterized protein n=2 Tax=Methanocalculus taiwanensis TaxID=106207 RepID=A0ABD4TGD8_9EURY|nr:hypothetical protein [Methanocalculus taiwanensis]
MRSIPLMILLLALALAMPAGAFTADNLALSVQENGDADIRFDYTLNWIERFAVFLRIANPADEFRSALERAYKKPVDVKSVSSGSAVFRVEGLASLKESEEGVRYSVPALDFSYAVVELEKYWFAPLVQVDLTPDLTTLTFPDGHTESFVQVAGIPATSHTISF